jgi:hypothetical protein
MPAPVKQMDRLQQVAATLGVEKRSLMRGKPRMLTDLQRAKQLGISLSQLKTPFQLSPAAPRAKSAYLDLYSSLLVLSSRHPPRGRPGSRPLISGPATLARRSRSRA